jgi:dihydropteroate synthase
MHGEPQTMQVSPMQGDVVHLVHDFFRAQFQRTDAAGIDKQRLMFDPGIGFGKTVEQNYQLLANLKFIAETGYPLVLGVSRKSMIGAVTGQSVDQRLTGSITAALAGVLRGARILRVHDVRETRDALAVWHAVQDAENKYV